MSEKDLIRKIENLKEIKPEKDWVVLTRKQLLGFNEPRRRWEAILGLTPDVFANLTSGVGVRFRLVAISLVVFGVLAGSFGLAQYALPGDPFYPIKKLTEKAAYFLVAKDQQPQAHLEMANKRLDELTTIAKNNQVRNLASAINEFKDSLSQAANTLKRVDGSPKLTKEIIKESEKLTENREKIEALGVVVGETPELNEALSQLVEREIGALEDRSLNEEQKKLLEQAEEDYQKGNFNQALEKILKLSVAP